jgi:hypothetical protein
MPWYYAGSEAKPVGPISLEELHAARSNGAITPETYVLEHSGQPGGAGAWHRYREVFPASLPLPPVPMTQPVPAPVPHPLFPSATGTAPVFQHAAPHGHYPIRRTNALCAWGFGLGVAGFILSITCTGILLAIPALIMCVLGFTQVQRRPDQSGRGLAVAGFVLAVLGTLISLGILAWFLPAAIKQEQAAMLQNAQ